MKNKLHINSSKVLVFFYFIASLCFFIFLLNIPPTENISYSFLILVIFVLLLCVTFFYFLFRKNPVIILDEYGISDKRYLAKYGRKSFVPWSDIEHANFIQKHINIRFIPINANTLYVVLKEPKKYNFNLNWFQRTFLYGDGSMEFALGGTDAKKGELDNWLNKHLHNNNLAIRSSP